MGFLKSIGERIRNLKTAYRKFQIHWGKYEEYKDMGMPDEIADEKANHYSGLFGDDLNDKK